MSEEPLAIDVRDLKKSYSDDVRALDGISFEVPGGTVFGLLGPNGAGKSTTIKILTTLTRPDSGEVKIAGIDVMARPSKVRRVIGCVAQQSGVDPAATGRENLILQGRLYGLRGGVLKDRVDRLLDRFHLTTSAGRLAKNYSSGMRRKLDVAMGLVHQPQVLFLDEPTASLDPEARSELWQEIVKLAGEGVTVILTTHYLEEADELAHDLAILDEGRLVAQGSPDRLKNELRGDAIQVELAEPFVAEVVEAALGGLDHVRNVVTSERRLSARVDDGASAAPAVLSALEGAGLRVVSVTLSAPTLDDVYLRHAGRTFRSAHEEATR